MAAITWNDVKDVAQGVCEVTEEAQTMILALVNNCLNISGWGGEDSEILKLARCYLAAHYGQISSPDSSNKAGPVTAETGGGLSRSYAFSAMDPLFDTTIWGRAYQTLARQIFGGPHLTYGS